MSWRSRLVNAFRADRLADELDEELRFHLEARTAELVAKGWAKDAAAREARRRLGDPLRHRETSRDVKVLAGLEAILQDARFGLRLLRKDAVVTGAAVVSLALAIGACTAAFSLIEALVLRPLPVSAPERLVYLAFAGDRWDGTNDENASFSYPLFERLRDAGRPVVDLFGVSYQGMRTAVFDDSGGREEKVRPQFVSGDAFAVLGVQPALGRLLTAEDDATPGARPVAVLSHAFWTRRFGRDPSVLGRWVSLEGRKSAHVQIVGVAGEGLTGTEPGRLTDLWVPNAMREPEALTRPDWQWFRVWGRLRPGVEPETVRSALQGTLTAFRRERAATFRTDESPGRIARFIAAPLIVHSAARGPSDLRDDFERPLLVLAAVAGLVLLIACSNVANLLLARAAARDGEMALRLSIGADRARVVQQVLVESGILAAASSLLGLAVGVATAPWIVGWLSPAGDPAYLDLRLDAPVVGFAVLLSALATVLFGLAPALRASSVAPGPGLKGSGGRHTAGGGLLRPLVAVQVGVAFVVLFLGLLLVSSFGRLAAFDAGFDKQGVVLFDVDAKDLRKGGARALAVWRELEDRVRGLAGVEAAGSSTWGLFSGSGWSEEVRFPGRETGDEEPYYLAVSPGFFETLRMRLLAGRDFRPADADPEQPTAVVVNESFARRYFPGEDALGRRFARVETSKELLPQEVVGVVRDAKYRSLREPTRPTVYLPLRAEGSATLEVRAGGDPLAIAAAVREEIGRVHPGFRVVDVNTQAALVDETLLRERLLAVLSAFFAIVALLLAAVGLYGVLSYGVVRRTKEIGIRMALGARPGGVAAFVVGDVLRLVAIGLFLGAAAGYAASGAIASLLFEVRPSDARSFAGPGLFLLAAAVLAAWPAARRAARLDPMVALRCD
jgi:predicted permease